MTKPPYDYLSKIYDLFAGDREQEIDVYASIFKSHNPSAKTLLEIGCGTGALLKHFMNTYDVTGLDNSPSMLTEASKLIPQQSLICADMAKFTLSKTFDIIYSPFDTYNHLLKKDFWDTSFQSVHSHCHSQSVFAFDVNTISKLHKRSKLPPTTFSVNEDTSVTLEVIDKGFELYVWDIKCCTKTTPVDSINHEEIYELAISKEEITEMLYKYFESVEIKDFDRKILDSESERLLFVCTVPKKIDVNH